jgi:hypothetical protein
MSLQRLRRSAITATSSLSSPLSSYSSPSTVPTVLVGRLATRRSINTRSSCRSRLLFHYNSDVISSSGGCGCGGYIRSSIESLSTRKIRTKTFSTRRNVMTSSSSSSSFFTEASLSNNDENNDDDNNNNDSMNIIKEEEEEEVYTIESLRNYAQQLIMNNNNNSYRYCLYLAGGGSMAISTLAATPGSSSFLLEGRTTYNRFSYLNACTMSDYDTKGKSFSYGSKQAAIILSNSALKQALKLTSLDDNLVGMPLTIGVGCTSILATTTNTKSGNHNDNANANDGGGGRGNVVVTRADGIRLTLTIQMKAGRERFDEDLMLSHLVLRSIELLMMYNSNNNNENANANANASIENEKYNNNNNKEYITRAGDIVTEQWELSTTSLSTDDDDDASTTSTNRMVGDNNEIDSVIEEAARRVVDGGEDAVVLLPLYGSSTGTSTTAKKKVLPSIIGIRALSQTVVPNNCLIFPGSFNPPHIGHLQLANASIRTLERLQPYIHPRNHNDKPILFELSLTNVDKPSIDPNIVVSRIRKILELYSSTTISNDNDTPEFPQQWGIVLTRAPLFEEKLKILRSKVLVADDDDDHSSTKKINFVIGTDTLVRILNPKYYQDQLRINMNKSLLELKSNGVGFIIGGRLEQQQKQSTSSQSKEAQSSQSQPRFVSGRDELIDLPEDVASMFTVMKESEFRVDLSSSDIRKQQQEEEKQEKIVNQN